MSGNAQVTLLKEEREQLKLQVGDLTQALEAARASASEADAAAAQAAAEVSLLLRLALCRSSCNDEQVAVLSWHWTLASDTGHMRR